MAIMNRQKGRKKEEKSSNMTPWTQDFKLI